MFDPKELLPTLVQGTKELADKEVKHRGFTTPYLILFKDFHGTPEQENDIIMTPGSPVPIIINFSWVMWCLMYQKNIMYRHKIHSALERMHLMHRTLDHPIPLTKALELRHHVEKGEKEWVKAANPISPSRNIDRRYLSFDYSVTVTDSVSGTSITLSGDKVEDVEKIAIERLSRMIYETEDLEEMHERMEEILRSKSLPAPPSRLIIDGDTNSVRTKMEY